MGLSGCMLRLMRSVTFIASPFRQLRKTCGDEGEHINLPNYMDNVQQPVFVGEATLVFGILALQRR